MQVTAKTAAAARIITEQALQAVASKNGVPVQFVVAQLKAGNKKAFAQLLAYIGLGAGAALDLHAQGQISLV